MRYVLTFGKGKGLLSVTLKIFFDHTRYLYSEIQHFYSTHDSNGSVLCDDVANFMFHLENDGLGPKRLKMKHGWQLHLYISQSPCRLW